MRLLPIASIAAVFSFQVLGHSHSSHEQIPIAEDADWATKHMAEEHHINAFDAHSFFILHDFSGVGKWSTDDIKRFYGLYDKSNAHLSDEDKDAAVKKILQLYDVNQDNEIDFWEFQSAESKGIKLPDLGYGPGHHGNDEYEYEIHHWEKYHGGDEDVNEEDLTHPEDIEHFRLHEQQEQEEEDWEAKLAKGIVEENIPAMFLRTE